MTENYFEYAVDEKATGKTLLKRILLIVSYVLFVVVFFAVFYVIRIPQLFALIPFLLVVLVYKTWSYVSRTFEYIIATGEITFTRIYSLKRRKVVLKLSVKELKSVSSRPPHAVGQYHKVYDFRGSAATPDSYTLTFENEKGEMCLVYFEATNKALKLLHMYNSATVIDGTMRY